MTLVTAAIRNFFTLLQAHGMENLRHGEAVFFLSGCRSQTPYSTKASEYKKILQISKNNSVFILYIQNKAIPL